MLALIIFIAIVSSAVALLLFFNKGEQAQQIKSVLNKILLNLKDLFINLKDLFYLLKEIISNEPEPEESLEIETKNQPIAIDINQKTESTIPVTEVSNDSPDKENFNASTQPTISVTEVSDDSPDKQL